MSHERRRTLSLRHLLAELPSILVQLRQRLVAVLEELRLGLHQRQHLRRTHWVTRPPTGARPLSSVKESGEWRQTHRHHNVRLLLGLDDVDLKHTGKLACVSVSTELQRGKYLVAARRHKHQSGGVKESECISSTLSSRRQQPRQRLHNETMISIFCCCLFAFTSKERKPLFL